jgi:hypothetical protein
MDDTSKLNATVEIKVTDRELIMLLLGVIESNTKAMEEVAIAVQADAAAFDKVAEVIAMDAAATEKMSIEVKGMRKTIALAQQRVGGELGAVIEKSKETLVELNLEREEVRRAQAGSEAARRSGPDARS